MRAAAVAMSGYLGAGERWELVVGPRRVDTMFIAAIPKYVWNTQKRPGGRRRRRR